MDKETIRLVEISEYLATGSLGRTTRRRIDEVWESSSQIVCDFSHVLGMTGEYADEAFGKMFLERGSADYINKLRFQNLNDVVQIILKGTLYQRYTEMKGGWDWMN